MKINNISKDLARHPTKKYKTRLISKIDTIIIHCSDHATATPEDIARWDITPTYEALGKVYKNNLSDTGAPGMTYHDFVYANGDAAHCQDYNVVTWHAAGHNTRSLSVCIQYRATGNKKPPTKKCLSKLVRLLTFQCLYLGILPVLGKTKGHRECKGTGFIFDTTGKKKLRKTCPGLLVDLDDMRKQVATRLQKKLQSEGIYLGAIDGLFGKKSKAALKQFQIQTFPGGI